MKQTSETTLLQCITYTVLVYVVLNKLYCYQHTAAKCNM